MKYFILTLAVLFFSPSEKDLYIMYHAESGLFKIGQSKDCDRRLKEVDYLLNCKTDGDVILVKVYKGQAGMEKVLHTVFKSSKEPVQYCKKNLVGRRIISREWRRLSVQDMAAIDCILNYK